MSGSLRRFAASSSVRPSVVAQTVPPTSSDNCFSQVPIAHAEEVEEVFDAISYYKGACVVRMVFAVVGEENFREGLRRYFQKYGYGNTVTTELWDAWSEVSGKVRR